MSDLLLILVRPRETMRRVLETRGRRLVVPLVLLASFSAVLTRSNELFGATATLRAVNAAINVVAWVILFHLFAWIALVAGRFLGGTGTARDVRAALAWGLVPLVWAIVYRLPVALFAGSARGGIGFDIGDGGVRIGEITASGCVVPILLAVVELAVLVWSIVAASNTVAEAHRFSSLRGAATIGIAASAPVVIVIAAVLAAVI